jgi:hypothetical protein
VIPAMQVCKKALIAVRHPLDRPANIHRGMCRNNSFTLQEELEAKCTADIRCDDVDVVRAHID